MSERVDPLLAKAGLVAIAWSDVHAAMRSGDVRTMGDAFAGVDSAVRAYDEAILDEARGSTRRRLDDAERLGHARFMAAGWRRLAAGASAEVETARRLLAERSALVMRSLDERDEALATVEEQRADIVASYERRRAVEAERDELRAEFDAIRDIIGAAGIVQSEHASGSATWAVRRVVSLVDVAHGVDAGSDEEAT